MKWQQNILLKPTGKATSWTYIMLKLKGLSGTPASESEPTMDSPSSLLSGAGRQWTLEIWDEEGSSSPLPPPSNYASPLPANTGVWFSSQAHFWTAFKRIAWGWPILAFASSNILGYDPAGRTGPSADGSFHSRPPCLLPIFPHVCLKGLSAWSTWGHIPCSTMSYYWLFLALLPWFSCCWGLCFLPELPGGFPFWDC